MKLNSAKQMSTFTTTTSFVGNLESGVLVQGFYGVKIGKILTVL
jgi:hypothetical protein